MGQGYGKTISKDCLPEEKQILEGEGSGFSFSMPLTPGIKFDSHL